VSAIFDCPTNSQSLFATLASRLVQIADGAPILEFGLRRAQAIGGFEPTRGSYLGGVAGTSNMEAAMYYNIPAAGTFAHAFVMTYEDELDAFREWAGAMPYSGVFLVDTYDTVEGVKKAVQACREKGIKLKGIRLDSGDLAYLSNKARQIMDEAGFTEAKVVASNDLDEATIADLKLQEETRIDLYGIGTNLATSKAQPALGAVYKLGAVYNGNLSQHEIDQIAKAVKSGHEPDGDYVRDVIKLSENKIKTTIPGELDVLRFIFREANGHERYDGDMILKNIAKDPVTDGKLNRAVVSIQKDDESKRRSFGKDTKVMRPLVRFFDQGVRVIPFETVHDGRKRASHALSMLEKSHKRLTNSHIYGVGLEEDLFNQRKEMIHKLSTPKPGG
jgi:nicotinate phosphoribosyltransferase